LRQTAHEVDLRQSGLDFKFELAAAPKASGSRQPASAGTEHERILIHVTDAPSAVGLIRRGRRVADYLRADCFAVCVVKTSGLTALPAAERESLERHLDFARKLHIDTRVLESDDSAEALVGFARTNRITQIFLSKPHRRSIPFLSTDRTLVMNVIRLARDIQVTVVADRHAARS
jgi:two-component system sensor histidine kinase KdpD